MAQGKTVLLIDDNADARELVSSMLQELGYAVTACAGVAEAVGQITSGAECDIVVTDFVMPETTGLELANLVRRWRPKTPVVLITGHLEAIDTAVEDGVIPLLKPFSLEQLRAVVAEGLRRPG